MLLKLECSIEQLYRCELFNCHMWQIDAIQFVFVVSNNTSVLKEVKGSYGVYYIQDLSK